MVLKLYTIQSRAVFIKFHLRNVPRNPSFTDDIYDRLCLSENSKQRVDGGEDRVGDRSEGGQYRVHQPVKHKRYALKGLCHEMNIF